jgi:large subunit ribosomal protein L27
MAHKKGQGSTENGRDSKSKRLGIKLYGGQVAKAGNIIVRQRGTKYHAGENAYLGKDYTIHAAIDGRIQFRRGLKDRVFVNVLPSIVTETVAKIEKPIVTAAPKAKPVAAPVIEEKVEKVATPVAEEKPKAKSKAKSGDSGKDDLKKIEGIGPKIESLLNEAGIFTFASLAGSDVEKLKEILEAAGSRYRIHDPNTWTKQASIAAEGNWEALKKLQDELKGGKEA